MKARDRTAGDRDEEDREQVKAVHFEARESGHADFGVLDENARHRAKDHPDEQEHREVVARRLQSPHRNDRRGEEVREDDVAPGFGVRKNGKCNPRRDHRDHKHHARHELNARRGLRVLEEEPEKDGHNHVKKRNRGGGRVRDDFRTVLREPVEGPRDHVAESGDHEKREEPAKEEKELPTRATDIVFDDGTDRAAVVLHRRVESRKVLHGAEEDPAHEHPEERGQPPEHRRDDGTRDGARPGNRGELVREHGPARRGREVASVVETHGGRGFLGVDPPGFFEPARVSEIPDGQSRERDDNHGEPGHTEGLLTVERETRKKEGENKSTTPRRGVRSLHYPRFCKFDASGKYPTPH